MTSMHFFTYGDLMWPDFDLYLLYVRAAESIGFQVTPTPTLRRRLWLRDRTWPDGLKSLQQTLSTNRLHMFILLVLVRIYWVLGCTIALVINKSVLIIQNFIRQWETTTYPSWIYFISVQWPDEVKLVATRSKKKTWERLSISYSENRICLIHSDVSFFKQHALSWVILDGLGAKITSDFTTMLTSNLLCEQISKSFFSVRLDETWRYQNYCSTFILKLIPIIIAEWRMADGKRSVNIKQKSSEPLFWQWLALVVIKNGHAWYVTNDPIHMSSWANLRKNGVRQNRVHEPRAFRNGDFSSLNGDFRSGQQGIFPSTTAF